MPRGAAKPAGGAGAGRCGSRTGARPINGGHPPGPQPAPERGGTAAIQMNESRDARRSAALRMAKSSSVFAPRPGGERIGRAQGSGRPSMGSWRPAKRDRFLVGLTLPVRDGSGERREFPSAGCVLRTERAGPYQRGRCGGRADSQAGRDAQFTNLPSRNYKLRAAEPVLFLCIRGREALAVNRGALAVL